MKVNDKNLSEFIEYMSKHCAGTKGMPCHEKSKEINKDWCKHALRDKKTCSARLLKKLTE
jgi:hypothetical protein